MNRRDLLQGGLWAAGLGLVAGVGVVGVAGLRSRSTPHPLTGGIASAGLAARGHRWREPFTPGTGRSRCDVVIVGAGVSGLSAAWRLAGSGLSVRLLELWDAPGGTAIAGTGPRGAFPWGAHYLTLPGKDAVHVRRLLRETGVITGEDAEGRPTYGDALCPAPQERIWDAGQWLEGLWPEAHAEPEDLRQRDAWEELVDTWTARVGADGLPAFTIPVAKCSMDPEIRALADVSFADWLTAQGFTAPVLRWTLEYATRDDFGARIGAVSAWAGLHYHCSRRPDVGDARDLGTHVLTWPQGNGWLVERLVERAGVRVETGAVVRGVETDAESVRVYVETDGISTIDARYVILAVPSRLAHHLLPALSIDGPDQAPWRVAQLQVARLPAARGVPSAWDSVLYGANSLGYVNSAHTLGYRGPAVLTWYEPADDRKALETTWEEARDRVLDDLSPAHPDLLDVLERLDVWHWGHGTVIPGVGVHRAGRLSALEDIHPRIFLAHTDLSGMSLFEEASWHGIRAAERIVGGGWL